MDSNTRSKRELKRVNYAYNDDDTSESEELIPYSRTPTPHLAAETNLDADGDVEIEDARSDAEVDMPSEIDVMEDLDDEDGYDGEGMLSATILTSTTTQCNAASLVSRNRHYNPSVAGFVSLPPELRLKIYKLVLVKKPSVDFGSRRGFRHSSGLLSVCKVVAEEGEHSSTPPCSSH